MVRGRQRSEILWSDDSHVTTMPWQQPSHNKQRQEPAERQQARLKMMFRSAHADEDSGSDWDDYSPAPTPLPTEEESGPRRAGAKPSIATTTTASTRAHATTTAGDTRHHSSHKANVQIQAVSSSPADHVIIPNDHVIRPLETQLTRISTVSPPRTPATFAPTAPAAAAYRTTPHNEGENPGNQGSHGNATIEASLDGDGGQIVQPQPGDDRALDFTRVSDESAAVLSPSYDLPYSYMAGVAEKSELYAKRCTEEVFSTLRVVSDFIIAFLLGCCHYLLNTITRKLVCGMMHIYADSLCKPLLHTCFNGYCWPMISMCSHMCKGCVVILTPLLDLLRAVVAMVTNCVAAFRPVHVNIGHRHHSNA